jgi:hypothetical protein
MCNGQLTLHKGHSAGTRFWSPQSALFLAILDSQVIPVSVNHFELDDRRGIYRPSVGYIINI